MRQRKGRGSKDAGTRRHAAVKGPEPLAPAPEAGTASDEGAAPLGPLPMLQALVVNAVPLWGIWHGGWSTSTTLAVYWCENVLGAMLVALRLALHRRLTNARGYERNQLDLKVEIKGKGDQPITGFLPAFLIASLGFSVAHGLFLAFLLFALLPQLGGAKIDTAALQRGVVTVTGFLLLAFAMDVVNLRHRPFAWARDLANRSLSRVMVVHLTIMLGMAVMAWQGKPEGFIGVFAVLKILLDVSANWPRRKPSRRVPSLLARLARKAKPGEDPQRAWEDALDRQAKLEAADEERG